MAFCGISERLSTCGALREHQCGSNGQVENVQSDLVDHTGLCEEDELDAVELIQARFEETSACFGDVVVFLQIGLPPPHCLSINGFRLIEDYILVLSSAYEFSR